MTNKDNFNNTDHSAAVDTYDRGIIPAETAARKEREKDAYKKTPRELHQDEGTEPDPIHTTDGYTVDKEGLIDNFPIEPEMYINEPGDLREAEEAEKARRAKEVDQVTHNDETGKLTMEEDTRGRGQGLI
jgi:hypothetical protein